MISGRVHLSAGEVQAKYPDLSLWKVYRLLVMGRLPYVRIAWKRWVPDACLADLMPSIITEARALREKHARRGREAS